MSSASSEGDEQRDPSVEAIIRITAEVGVSLAWLLDGVAQRRPKVTRVKGSNPPSGSHATLGRLRRGRKSTKLPAEGT